MPHDARREDGPVPQDGPYDGTPEQALPDDDTRRGAPVEVAPLVQPEWLREHLSDPTVVTVEVGDDSGAYYDEGHVPGAVALSWLDDLHEPDRRGVLSQPGLEALLGRAGITPEQHVVLYGGHDNLFAAAAFWLLRYYRHRAVSLLDGGRQAWVASGGELAQEPVQREAVQYRSPGPDHEVRLTRDTLLERFVGGGPGTRVVDMRTGAEFRGRNELSIHLPVLRHRMAGHVPGAVNVPVLGLLEEGSGRFRSREQLESRFRASDVRPEEEVAVYCDVGGRGAVGWFVLHELLGYPRVRHYDGGWSEYGSLVGAPVEQDDPQP